MQPRSLREAQDRVCFADHRLMYSILLQAEGYRMIAMIVGRSGLVGSDPAAYYKPLVECLIARRVGNRHPSG